MLAQDYHAYTKTDRHTWKTLYMRQVIAVHKYAYQSFFRSLGALGFGDDHIPNFEGMNLQLRLLTGWGLYAVPGLIDNEYFFRRMKDRKFGATTWLRRPDQLDYLEEPDMFHDVFGHVPLLADPQVTSYLSALAALAANTGYDGEVVEAIARLYWYTVEFGLVRESSQLKIYGAGILSSIGETKYCMSDQANLVPFDVEKIIATPYIKDNYQQQYFVLSSMDELQLAASRLNEIFHTKIIKHAALPTAR